MTVTQCSTNMMPLNNLLRSGKTFTRKLQTATKPNDPVNGTSPHCKLN